jgi:hypothetical protein
MGRSLLAVSSAAALACALFFAPSARADMGQDEAGMAYDAAARAYAAHEYPTAARLFARADEIAPLPVMLGLALDAVLQTDDAALGMVLVNRARARAPRDATVQQKASLVAAKFAPPTAPAPPAPPPPPPPVPLMPPDRAPTMIVAAPATKSSNAWFFWGATGVTVAAGLATLVSALDYRHLHGQLEHNPANPDLAASSHDARVRTNALLGTLGVAVLATAVIGLFVVDWKATR